MTDYLIKPLSFELTVRPDGMVMPGHGVLAVFVPAIENPPPVVVLGCDPRHDPGRPINELAPAAIGWINAQLVEAAAAEGDARQMASVIQTDPVIAASLINSANAARFANAGKSDGDRKWYDCLAIPTTLPVPEPCREEWLRWQGLLTSLR